MWNWTKIVIGSTLIAAALFVGPLTAVAFCFCGTVQILTAGISIMEAANADDDAE